jgi:hypothetical protein
MAAWDIDLTTRIGAREATRSAASACGVFGLLFGYALFRLARLFDLSTVPVVIIAFAGFILVTAFVAAWRFYIEQGAWAGIAMLLALVVLNAVAILIAVALADGFSIFIVIPLTAICTVVGLFAFNGIRGARALGTVTRFDDDDVEIFS